MEKLTRLLNRLANWKAIVILILIALPFNLVIFPMRSARLKELSGKSAPIIDAMFAYTPAQVYELVPAYGEQGRQLYAVTELTADLLYPILYSLLLGVLMTLIFRQAFASASFMQKLRLLPFVAALTDYAENITVVTLLLRYPQKLTGVAWAASLFTTAKWVLAGVSLILMVIGLAALLVKKDKIGPV
jgi:hypothetical protein